MSTSSSSRRDDEVELLKRNKKIARKPFGTVCYNQIQILWPGLWIKVAKMRSVDLSKIHSSMLGIVLPVVSYHISSQLLLLLSSEANSLHHYPSLNRVLSEYTPTTVAASKNQSGGASLEEATTTTAKNSSTCTTTTTTTTTTSTTILRVIRQIQLFPDKNVLIAYLLSPWTLAMIYRSWESLSSLTKAVNFTRFVLRSTTLDEAWDILATRISENRAYRTRRYDVYLPPPSATVSSPESSSFTTDAILFLPGAGVEEVAYARPVSMLADAGYLVVVVSAEPLRMASPLNGFAAQYIRRHIMDHVEKHHPSIKIQTWYGVGHSLGGFTLSTIAKEIGFSTLVFWGSAPFIEALEDLSSATDLKLRIIQGSEDGVIKMISTPENTAEFWRRLPGSSRTLERVIKGGTHSGFASYRPASIFGKEQPGISRHDQHEAVVKLTVEFIQQSSSSSR